MAANENEDIILDFDGDGFLKDPTIWNEEVAKKIAKEDGIDKMNEKHWAIVNIIRQWWP